MKRARMILSGLLALMMLMGLVPAGAEEQPVLEYASLYTEGESYAKWFKEMGEKFEAETGIKVEFTFAGRDVITKMRSRILAGDPPDIIDQKMTELSAALLQDEILLEPIDDFFYETPGPEGQDTMMDIFFEDSLKIWEKEGHLYFYPYKVNTGGFFYNKVMFQNLGLEVPQTWDEFLNVCEVLKANGIAPLAQDGNINFYNAFYFYWLSARELGSGAFQAAASDPTGEMWDDPAFLKVAQMVYDLSPAGKDYFKEGFEGSVWPAGQVDWALGGAAMIVNGTWVIVETQSETADDFEYGFFPFPTIDGGAGQIDDVEISYIGGAIPKGAKHPELAKQFFAFCARAENVQAYCDITVSVPGRRDVEYPEVLSDVKEMMESSTVYHTDYDGTLENNAEWLANVFYSLDNQLVFGEITPEDFIAQLKKTQIDYYASK